MKVCLVPSRRNLPGQGQQRSHPTFWGQIEVSSTMQALKCTNKSLPALHELIRPVHVDTALTEFYKYLTLVSSAFARALASLENQSTIRSVSS